MKYFATVFLFLAYFMQLLAQKEYIYKKISKSTGPLASVCYHPDNTKIIFGGADKLLYTYNVLTEEATSIVTGHVSPLTDVTYNKTGLYIYTTGDRSIKRWSSEGEILKNYTGNGTNIWSIGVTAKEDAIISGSFENMIRVWDNLTEMRFTRSLEAHDKSVLAVAFSNNDQLIASGSLDMQVILWDRVSGKQLKVFRGHTGNIYDVEFTPDDKYLVSCSKDKTIKIWNVETGALVRTLLGHSEAVNSIDISSDGKLILSAGFDKTITLWNATDGKDIYTFSGHEGAVNDVAFAPSSDRFASVSEDKNLIIWALNPLIFVEKYFLENYEKDKKESPLFKPQKESESKADYKIRLEKQDAMNKVLIHKYYQEFFNQLKHSSIDESTANTSIIIK